MLHQVYIGIGSNIEREHHTKTALKELSELFGKLTISNVYESEAVGFNGANFYNLVVGVQTECGLDEVCLALRSIEFKHGRQQHEKKFAPRTLDLDLLLFDDVVCCDTLVLPREEIEHNAFVLLPLSEVAPDTIHPIAQKTMAWLWQHYDKSKQKLWKIDINWDQDLL